MKKCLTLLLNLVVVSSFAQFDFIPKPTEAKFEMGLVPALSIQVFQGDISAVQKSWENVLKKKEAKVSSSKMGMKAENAVFPEISSTSVNVHTSFKELEESVIEMTVAFDLGSASCGMAGTACATQELCCLCAEYISCSCIKIWERHSNRRGSATIFFRNSWCRWDGL